jgi:hypothetical protein
MPLSTRFGDSLPQNGVHGMDEEVDVGLVRMGVRHMRPGDGLWLQPEPLLGLGVPGERLATPRSVVGVYAAGKPVDRTGLVPVVPVAVGAVEVLGNAAHCAAVAGVLVAGPTAGAMEVSLTVGGAALERAPILAVTALGAAGRVGDELAGAATAFGAKADEDGHAAMIWWSSSSASGDVVGAVPKPSFGPRGCRVGCQGSAAFVYSRPTRR